VHFDDGYAVRFFCVWDLSKIRSFKTP